MTVSRGMTQIVLADDHEAVREGLRSALHREPDLAVAGEAEDGCEALELVLKLQPAVLVLDLERPELRGVEVLRQIKKRRAATRTVVFTIYGGEDVILEALQEGARAYVLKGAPMTDLVRAVREVARGGLFLSPPLSLAALQQHIWDRQGGPVDPYAALSPCQRQVLERVVEGQTSAAIGKHLGISQRTVEWHRSNILQSLGLKSPAELIRHVVRSKLS